MIIKRIYRILRGIFAGAFVGLFLGGGVGVLLEKIFGFEADSLGCIIATVGIIFGILSGFIGPIHTIFKYIYAVLVLIFLVCLLGISGFAIGKDFGPIVWGEVGRQIGSIVGATFGVILGLTFGIINGLILIGRTRIPIDEYQ